MEDDVFAVLEHLVHEPGVRSAGSMAVESRICLRQKESLWEESAMAEGVYPFWAGVELSGKVLHSGLRVLPLPGEVRKLSQQPCH